jgi:hypothetical protein
MVITKYHEVQSTNTAQIHFSKKKRKKKKTIYYKNDNANILIRFYKWKEKE